MSKIEVKHFKFILSATEVGMTNTNEPGYIGIPKDYAEEIIKYLSKNVDECLKLLPIKGKDDYREAFTIEDIFDHEQIKLNLELTPNAELRLLGIKHNKNDRKEENTLVKFLKKHKFDLGDELSIIIWLSEGKLFHKYLKTEKHCRVLFKHIKDDQLYQINNLNLLEKFKTKENNFIIEVSNLRQKIKIQYVKEKKIRSLTYSLYDVRDEDGSKIFLKDFYLEKENDDANKFTKCSPIEDEYNIITESYTSEVNDNTVKLTSLTETNIIQRIFYGAPGTGKSHTIKQQTEGKEVIRTTFHPDSDYASFVGAYKPTTTQVPKYVMNGLQPTEVTDSNGKPILEEKITYNFIPQAFLNAYISAWKKLAKTPDNETEEKVYLIIEEINRGNCAQIFGDLFQLLDRKEDGFSDYPIKADADMQKQLAKEFNGITIQNSILSNEISNKVLNGEILLLPRNLFIWATMNTSDQSLFPIDSAFKRRWDWTYVPIYNAEKQWKIQIGNNTYDWWNFLEKINEKIEALTNAEDKKLGYFFCKATNNVISGDVFVGKVIFYLWNDVFKDYEFEDDVFKDEDGSKLIFNKFYIFDGTKTVIDEGKVIKFLSNLKVENETTLEMDGNSTEETQPQEQTEEPIE